MSTSLCGIVAAPRLEQARELHRQRRAARDAARVDDIGPRRAHDRDRIDAMVIPEPLVLERDERVDELRIDAIELYVQSPLVIGRQEHVRRPAVAILDDDRPAELAIRQRHREHEHEQHEQRGVDRGDRPQRAAHQSSARREATMPSAANLFTATCRSTARRSRRCRPSRAPTASGRTSRRPRPAGS